MNWIEFSFDKFSILMKFGIEGNSFLKNLKLTGERVSLYGSFSKLIHWAIKINVHLTQFCHILTKKKVYPHQFYFFLFFPSSQLEIPEIVPLWAISSIVHVYPS